MTEAYNALKYSKNITMIRSISLKHLFLIPVVIGFLYTVQEVQGGEYKHMNLSSIHPQLDYYNNEGMYFLKLRRVIPYGRQLAL